MPVDFLAATLRSLSFVALFQAAGSVIFHVIFGSRVPASAPRIRRLGLFSACAALVFVCGHYAMEAARMAGDFTGIADPTLQSLVWHSSATTTALLRTTGLLLIAAGLSMLRVGGPGNTALIDGGINGARSPANPGASGEPRDAATVTSSRWSARLALLGAVLSVVSFALTGHTADHAQHWPLAALLLAHLFTAAFWFGALLPLYLVSKHESATTAGAIVERFSTLAIWVVPALLAAGVGLAVVLLGSFAALAMPYGQVLLLKLAGFALLMILASLNKWRLGPALARGAPQTLATFRYCLIAEFALIAAVLTTTAILTTFFSPEP